MAFAPFILPPESVSNHFFLLNGIINTQGDPTSSSLPNTKPILNSLETKAQPSSPPKDCLAEKISTEVSIGLPRKVSD